MIRVAYGSAVNVDIDAGTVPDNPLTFSCRMDSNDSALMVLGMLPVRELEDRNNWL